MPLQPFRSKSFSINGKTELQAGATDLLINGSPAPVGSTYNRIDGTTWSKIGEGNTDWKELAATVKNKVQVQKVPTANQYESIADALLFITDASINNPYVIEVGPGVYVEPTIAMKPYIYLIGDGDLVTVIEAASPTQTMFIGSDNSAMFNLEVKGASGVGGIGIYHEGTGAFGSFAVKGCVFQDCETFISLFGTLNPSNTTLLQADFCRFGGVSLTPFKLGNANSTSVQLIFTNSIYGKLSAPFPATLFTMIGENVSAYINSCSFRIGVDGTTCFDIRDGAELRILSSQLRGFNTVFNIPNVGLAPTLEAQGINILDSVTSDFNIQHPGTKGSYFGSYDWHKTVINDTCPFFISNTDLQIVSVAKKGGDFDSIKEAVDAITDASVNKPYTVSVGPGTYIESSITMKQYVYVVGSGDQTSTIQAASPTQTTIIAVDNSGIIGFTITGATGVGGRAVYHIGSSTLSPFLIQRCYLANNETQVHSHGTLFPANITVTQVDSCRMGGLANASTPFKATNGDNVCSTQLIISNLIFQDVIAPFLSVLAQASGTGTGIVFNNGLLRIAPTSGSTGFHIENGAELRMIGTTMRGFGTAIYAPNTGTAPKIYCQGVAIDESVEYDLNIEHVGTIGRYFGSYFTPKVFISPTSTFFIPNKDLQVVTVSKKGGDYASIAAAVDSIADASVNKPYLISIGAGVFTEPLIQGKEYVSFQGSNTKTTYIIPDSNSHDVIKVAANSELSGVSIRNAGTGYAGVRCDNIGSGQSKLVEVDFWDCDKNISISATTANSFLFTTLIDVNGTYSNAIECTSVSGFTADVLAHRFYTIPVSGTTGSQIEINGPGSTIDFSSADLLGNGLGKGVYMQNGGSVHINASVVENTTTAIDVKNDSASEVILAGIDFENNTTNLNIASPTASGYLIGYSEYEKNIINPSSSFFIAEKDAQIIKVSKKGGDFESIKLAVDSITDASSTKPYVVSVGAGVYTEDPIVMKQYIYVKGLGGDQHVIVTANNVDAPIITGADNAGIENLLLTGATGTNGMAVYHEGNSTFVSFIVKSCLFGSNYTQATVFGRNQVAILQIEGCRMGGSYTRTNGFIAKNNPGFATQLSLVNNVYQDVIPGFATGDFIYATGTGTGVVISGLLARVGSPTASGIVIEDGAEARISDTSLRGFLKAIWVKNVGAAPLLKALSTALEGNTEDLRVDHPSTTGSFFGSTTASKVYVNPSSNYPLLFQDITNGSMSITGALKLGFSNNTYQDVSTLLIKGSTMGILEGGDLTDGGGLDVSVSAGFGYLESAPRILQRIDWVGTSITLAPNTTSYLYINSSGVVVAGGAYPDTTANIYLGKVLTGAVAILTILSSGTRADHTSNRYESLLRFAFGAIYVSGSTVTGNVTPLHLNVTSGEYYFATNSFSPSGGTDINFYKASNGVVDPTPTNVIDIRWDNGGTLTTLTAGYFVKHSIYVSGDGANEKYFKVYGQEEFSTQLLAEGGGIPLPPTFLTVGVSLIANVIVQQGNANVVLIQDARPTIGFKATGTSSSSDHSALSNLGSLTAHPQYLLKANTDAMGINLDMGGFSVTNVNLVDGVDVSAHASRHLPNGVDALTTAAPITNLSGSTTNAVGNANSLARSNHTHAVDNATISVAGFMSATDKTKLDAISGTNTGDNATNTTSNAYADGKVADVITNGVTTIAPSQNAVFDALALKLDSNTPIVGATKTKVTYDADGLITAGADATTADINDSTNRRYITDTQAPAWTEPLSTGLNSGGLISINANPARFDVSAGSGIIVNHSASPPTYTPVSWSAFTGVIVTNIATQFNTDIAINISGAIVQQVTFTDEELRSLIFLGGVDHNNQTTISDTFSITVPTKAAGSSVRELAFAVGDVNISGNIYSANGASLNINKTAGSVFSFGRNFLNNVNSPHRLVTGSIIATTFGYVFNNGSGIGTFTANTNLINPNQFDNGSGTLATVPSTHWTIQRILFFPNRNKTFMQYGTTTYTRKVDALDAIPRANFLDLLGIETAMTRGYIVLEQGETDLSTNAVFLSANKFGIVPSLSSGTSLGLSELVDTNITTVASDDIIKWNGSEWVNSKVATIHNAAPAKPAIIDADLVTGLDSANSFSLIKTTWTSVKAFLKTYFDTLYPSGSGTSTGTNTGDQIISDATITLSDITTNNFSTLRHGFTPKGTNVGNFLRDDGNWAAPLGDMALGGPQTVTGQKTFLDSTLLLRNPANTFSYTVATSAITAARQLNVPPIIQTETFAMQPQTYQASPTNPIGTTSIAGLMMGLAGAITPRVTGRIMITISGNLINSAGDNGVSTQIRYGTGTAPINGNALTGVTLGGSQIRDINASSGSTTVTTPFSCQGIVSGLTPGTPIWIDSSLAAIGGGTATMTNISITAFEL